LFRLAYNEGNWGVSLYASRNTEVQLAQLVIIIQIQRQNKKCCIKLDAIFATPIKNKSRNYLRLTLEIQRFLKYNPNQTLTNAARQFKTKEAILPQLFQIINSLPRDFIKKMERCQRRGVFKIFSDKSPAKNIRDQGKKETMG